MNEWGLSAEAESFIESAAILAEPYNERIDELEAQLAAVRQVIADARRISPSSTMSVYCVDIERALGDTDQAAPHKLGSNG